MKDATTNSLYQSTILPTIQKAETRIKSLVLVAFLYSYNTASLRYMIAGIILSVSKQLPKDMPNREAYITGLYRKSEQLINRYYTKPRDAFFQARTSILQTAPAGVKLPKIDTPSDLNKVIQNKRILWAEAKGSPNVVQYEKQLKQYINQLSSEPMVVVEPGKKPISIWQKAELDVRYEGQMKMLDDLKEKGVEYAWTSSHVNASKRCAKWQGKLMSLTQHATGSNFKVGTLDGYTVYSLIDIMAQTDKYGYNNNIICGFNCRHRLIPYKPGSVAPTHYDKGEIAQQRAIETKIRAMEREIRLQKTRAHLYEKLGDKKTAAQVNRYVKVLVDKYKNFCEANGYAWHQYRINII